MAKTDWTKKAEESLESKGVRIVLMGPMPCIQALGRPGKSPKYVPMTHDETMTLIEMLKQALIQGKQYMAANHPAPVAGKD